MLLLQKRYARHNSHSLQLVPDRHKGDLGIEAFSHDGFAYQCYAADEPLTVAQCYEKQRDKLTTDLGKLRTKKDDLGAMLGTVVLKRYVFMVHRHDSRLLVAHASTKASEVAGWGLAFIDPSFSIVVETDADYALERADLFLVPTPIVESTPPDPAAVRDWHTANDSLRETAAEKLEVIISSSSTRDLMLDSLIAQYLQGENALERLRSIVPDVHAGILASKSRHEAMLVLEYPPDLTYSSASLAKIAREFAAVLRADYQVLSEQLATVLAWAAVADWLMRCPLNFEAA
ncbi:hypothetical protein E4V99_10725 [Microbacterium sp. dk485]|uniref:hypothetical protein n=1 Tax=Microbacterium sp. dk485 TaxID=2560021 RepID=UPI00107399E8|nr:hypothetical protein [Microbacterium sp. dk485]TFV81471.1 hypothetical protein E4V99_10725 [Microbacterium sp. dk485]